MTMNDTRTLDKREISTILAALRNWQMYPMIVREQDLIASDDELILPLNDDEIDELCEAINCSAEVEIFRTKGFDRIGNIVLRYRDDGFVEGEVFSTEEEAAEAWVSMVANKETK